MPSSVNMRRRPRGGPITQKQWLSLPGIDFILDGNAWDFADLIAGLKPADAPGVITKPGSPVNNAPFPYSADMLKDLKGRIIYYEASHGCSFNCSYCLSSADSSPAEYRDIDKLTCELAALRGFEGTVKFVDRTFNSNPEISRAVWRYMTENPPAGCFHFELHPMLLGDEDFRLIERLPAGSVQFEIGIQSTDASVLRNVNRPDNPVESLKKIRRLSAMKKHHIHLDQIIGLPGDSPETAASSIDAILSLEPDKFQPGFLKLLPGTPLHSDADHFGIKASSEPPYEVLETSSFSFSELRHFHRIARLVEILYNSGFFAYTITYLAGKAGGWYRLFESLLNDNKEADLNCRQWQYWGIRLLRLGQRVCGEDSAFLKDLLRMDWCPFASSQHYPEFIAYADRKRLKALKAEYCIDAVKKYPQIEKSAIKRAILFIPEHGSRPPADSIKLFIKNNGETIIFTSR